MKKIALLYNMNRGQKEYETEFDSPITIDTIYEILTKKYIVDKIEAVRDFSWIEKITSFNPDLVFNICEGYFGPAREAVYAAIVEQILLNYTGPDSTNLLICHNKYLTKCLLKETVLAPFGYLISKNSDISRLKNIDYPVIIKLNSEGSSMGMDSSSVVYNYNNLKKKALTLLKTYGRNILVEEYIEGTDLSMVYVEGIGALGPCIVECNSKLYDYEMKTIKDSTVNIFEAPGEYNVLENIVLHISKKLDIKGYAKIDFRLRDGKYYLIEVNSQVSFHPDGEFTTCIKKSGYTLEKIINHIVEYAFKCGVKCNSTGVGDGDV